jgi:hypothetical protein
MFAFSISNFLGILSLFIVLKTLEIDGCGDQKVSECEALCRSVGNKTECELRAKIILPSSSKYEGSLSKVQ